MGLLLALVSKLSTAARRLVLGRPFRSDRLSHTLLPKRIALPVFASDALSSVAYAPEEVFLMLSVAGLAAYSLTPWIGVAVAAVMLVVVASYRQNVHAYPSGGGDFEVVTTNLGPNAGLTVASALMVDYVLTVAVSTASAMSNIGSAIPFVDRPQGAVLRERDRAGDGVEPAWYPRIRGGLRHPDLRVHRRRHHHARLGPVPDLRVGRTATGRIRRLCDARRTQFDRRLRVGVPGGAVLLLWAARR